MAIYTAKPGVQWGIYILGGFLIWHITTGSGNMFGQPHTDIKRSSANFIGGV
jgi:hypothetical protein